MKCMYMTAIEGKEKKMSQGQCLIYRNKNINNSNTANNNNGNMYQALH